jgi:hypothetical protein
MFALTMRVDDRIEDKRNLVKSKNQMISRKVMGLIGYGSDARQRSEQYFTCSQSRFHFLRQLNGRPQREHAFDGIVG